MSNRPRAENLTKVKILTKLDRPENVADGIIGSSFADVVSEPLVHGERVLNDLMTAGLVERRTTDQHKTAKPYFITQAGQKFLANARAELGFAPGEGQEVLDPPPQTRPRPYLSQKADGLIIPSAAEHREAMNRWQRSVSGSDGDRITHFDTPDDPLAYRLLEAAGDAIGRNQVQAGVDILQVVVKNFGSSKEAALARQALDQIKKQVGQGR